MSFKQTFLIALTTLFVIPLSIFMGHSLELGGTLSAWAGLFLGSLYGFCSLSVCWILLSRWEKRLLGLEEAQTKAATANESVAVASDGVALAEEVIEERELAEAIGPLQTEPDGWVEEAHQPIDGAIRTSVEGLSLLRSLLEKAENLDGLSSSSDRFRALSLDNFAIDMRRLFDLMRHETAGTATVIYSREETRLLFASEGVRRLFGWSPERFCERFPGLITGARQAWEEAIGQLELGEEAAVRIVIETKDRDSKISESVWAPISSGAFRGIVLGLLFI